MQFDENGSLMLLKPESATMIRDDIYIENNQLASPLGGFANSFRKMSMQPLMGSNEVSMVSFANDT